MRKFLFLLHIIFYVKYSKQPEKLGKYTLLASQKVVAINYPTLN